jgi:hypothetical protein
MLKRRTAVGVAAVSLPIRDLLLNGEIRCAAERDSLRDQGLPYNVLERFITSDAQLEAHWRAHRAALLVEWVQVRPGTRPWAWWQWDAPERRRRRLAGGGEPYAGDLAYGLPRYWTTPALAAHVSSLALDAANPPTFESEAAYLERQDGLTRDERPRLPPNAFDPAVIAMDESDD